MAIKINVKKVSRGKTSGIERILLRSDNTILSLPKKRCEPKFYRTFNGGNLYLELKMADYDGVCSSVYYQKRKVFPIK